MTPGATQAARGQLGLQKKLGHAIHHFVLTAADFDLDGNLDLMSGGRAQSWELLTEVYPQTEVRKQLSTYETLLSIDAAREVLGFEPQHSWRDEVKPA